MVNQQQQATTVEKPAAPAIGTPEYDAAMIQKFEESGVKTTAGDAPAPVARPDNIPEKFWDAEKGVANVDAMAAAYAELEQKQSKPAATAEDKAATDKAAADDEATKAAAKAVEAAGLNMDALSAEYAEAGVLSDTAYESLEKAGIPRAMVDRYIAGQAALQEAADKEGYDIVGGREQFNTIATWAAANLPATEVAELNKAMASSPSIMKLAVQSLLSKYEAAVGKAPALIGGTPPVNVGAGYESRAQMTADMKNPLYQTDPAYRAKVEARVAVTTAF